MRNSFPAPMLRRFTGVYYCIGSVICLLVQLLLPLRSSSQQLEEVGTHVSLVVTQTFAKPTFIDMGAYTLNTKADPSNTDDVGYRLSAYGRWRVGGSHFFVQPEVAYTSTRGQSYEYSNYPPHYYPLPGPYGPEYGVFAHQIHRWELAPLVGLHSGRRTYLLAGPVIAFNLREAKLATKSGYPDLEGLSNSLFQSVIPVQLLAQVGVGAIFGRFDFNLRLEQSLTPYTRRFTFEGTTYRYEQQIRQGLFTAGFLLYKKKAASF